MNSFLSVFIALIYACAGHMIHRPLYTGFGTQEGIWGQEQDYRFDPPDVYQIVSFTPPDGGYGLFNRGLMLPHHAQTFYYPRMMFPDPGFYLQYQGYDSPGGRVAGITSRQQYIRQGYDSPGGRVAGITSRQQYVQQGWYILYISKHL